MVKTGFLVKEHGSSESKPRMGTIVKATKLVLSKSSQWQKEVERWIGYKARNGNQDPDMNLCWVIRPGTVASVRWQDDPTKLSVHVFYDDCNGQSFYSHGSNGVEVISNG